MQRGGGIIALEDLALYQPRERTPVRGTYRGYEVISMPPPSSGGVAIIQMLNILEGSTCGPWATTRAVHPPPGRGHAAGVPRPGPFRRGPGLRRGAGGAADQQGRTRHAAAQIDATRAAIGAGGHQLPAESDETTHYSVVDASGMAVSVTYTLEAGYGSKITVPGAGFLLNNEMGDFNARPGLTTEAGLIGTQPNLARPEQRMLSSMTPTIIARDGHSLPSSAAPAAAPSSTRCCRWCSTLSTTAWAYRRPSTPGASTTSGCRTG
jgi:gamma-glutamyltranspeptidase / glutathione hydrolase